MADEPRAPEPSTISTRREFRAYVKPFWHVPAGERRAQLLRSGIHESPYVAKKIRQILVFDIAYIACGVLLLVERSAVVGYVFLGCAVFWSVLLIQSLRRRHKARSLREP
jgi:hypothetical protein